MKFLLIFLLIGCSKNIKTQECTKVAKVLNCLEEQCRVEFENGSRHTTWVSAVGDVYCRKVLNKSGQKPHYRGSWWGKN